MEWKLWRQKEREEPKITDDLSRWLGKLGAQDELVTVVVALTGGGSLSQGSGGSLENRIAAAHAAFDDQKTPVIARILEHGGEVLAEAWANRTLLSELPGKGVEPVAAEENVRVIDLAFTVEREGHDPREG